MGRELARASPALFAVMGCGTNFELGEPLTTSGIRRASPPHAVTKVRENYFLIQVSITETPSADWRRLFYDAQGQDVPPDFAPRSVEITGTFLRFKTDP
jgi:hypothetical protein